MGAIEYGDPSIANLKLIVGVSDQTIFAGTAIQNTSYRYGGSATGVLIENLPEGLICTKDSANKTITISGIPVIGGTYNIKTQGGINIAEVSGVITISSVDYAKLSSTGKTSQTINIGSSIEPVEFIWSGGATGISWTILPNGLTAAKDENSNKLTISGIPSEDGTFTVSTIGGLGTVSISVTITRVVPTRIITGDWYDIRDAYTDLPSDLSGVVSIGSGPTYLTVWDTAYTESTRPANFTTGAINVERGGYVLFNLPSLAELKFNMLTTGGRSVVIYYGVPGTSESEWTATTIPSFAKGTFTAWDVMAKGSIAETKSPISVKFYNPTSNGGGIRIYDFLVRVFDDNTTSSKKAPQLSQKYNLYQTETALIVNGEIERLRIYNIEGKLLSGSDKSQVVSTANLLKGVYILHITNSKGIVTSLKFIKNAN
jgi:hypothetical protein